MFLLGFAAGLLLLPVLIGILFFRALLGGGSIPFMR